MEGQNQDLKKVRGLPKKLEGKEVHSLTLEDTENLSSALALLFDGQKQFGKNSEQLENMIKLFCWVMKDYPLEKIMNGLAEYVRKNSDIPTPSDIIKIIDPPREEWKPDKAYYIRLQEILKASNFSAYAWSDEEKDYVNKYEEYMQLARKRGDV